MKFGFVDPDDDEVTETLEGYEGPGGAGAEEVDMQTAAEDEEMEERRKRRRRRVATWMVRMEGTTMMATGVGTGWP